MIAAAGFSLTACSGSDDNASSKPAATAESSTSGSQGSADGKGDTSADANTNANANADNGAGADGKSDGAGGSESPSDTETLVDGSTAEIYKLGDAHYSLKIVNDGDVLGELEANKQDAGMDGNGMFVVLTAGGDVRSWTGNEQQGPGTFDLAGGWEAKVTKVSDSHYRAQILGFEGGEVATLDADGHAAGSDANGGSIVLTPGGVISAHE
ncbi:hypothetical protein NKH77_21840 [Streptomyces sp. M19]